MRRELVRGQRWVLLALNDSRTETGKTVLMAIELFVFTSTCLKHFFSGLFEIELLIVCLCCNLDVFDVLARLMCLMLHF